jgi:hypothetical protein
MVAAYQSLDAENAVLAGRLSQVFGGREFAHGLQDWKRCPPHGPGQGIFLGRH